MAGNELKITKKKEGFELASVFVWTESLYCGLYGFTFFKIYFSLTDCANSSKF